MPAPKKNEKKTMPDEEIIRDEAMEAIMGERYATYAKYVIRDRAIPDARDGLKPVQRRIIYSMWKQGNFFAKPTRKCARIVGDVIGKYHPHGDSSIYDALVRMSQDWKNNAPLIDFQGNNGSIDNDPPAAYRYTESRLSQIAEELTRDLDEETVDMTLTFDDTELEPTVLPARFPNLFVNGAEGIAVALATEIPPHNLREVSEAIIYRLEHPEAPKEDLLNFVKGPDFPTGGLIYQGPGLTDIYLKGRGRIETAARTKIQKDEDSTKIIITEIPYKTVKIALVAELDRLRHDKIITGINEVRDESDRFGLRIVIDLKKEANVDVIHRYLLSKTGLRSAFSANMVAIVNGRPKTMTLSDYVDGYIMHQIDVITRKSRFELRKAKTRLHIVVGLVRALSILDDVVKTIRSAKDKSDAKQALEKAYDFTEAQSEAIVTLQLYKLTNTDVSILLKEKDALEKEIAFLTGILEDEKKLHKVLIKDIRAIVKKYGRDRRTSIVAKGDEKLTTFYRRDLITKEETAVAITRDGYFKRSPVKSWRGSGENALPGLKEGDAVVFTGLAHSTDALICFTDRGNYLFVPVYELLENKWRQEGRHISSLISLNPAEKIIRAFAVEECKPGLFFLLLSKRGQIKRIELSSLPVNRYNRPIFCFKLLGDDEVVDAAFTNGAMNVIVFAADGRAAFYPESDVSLATLRSGGNKAMMKIREASLTALLTYPSTLKNDRFLIISDKGALRIHDLASLTLSRRLGKTTLLYRSLKNDHHRLIAASKITSRDASTHLRFLTNTLLLAEFDVTDYHLTPLSYYARRNLEIKAGRKTRLSVLFKEDGERIKKSTVSHYVEPVKEEPKEKTEHPKTEKSTPEEGYTQISIFDDDLFQDDKEKTK